MSETKRGTSGGTSFQTVYKLFDVCDGAADVEVLDGLQEQLSELGYERVSEAGAVPDGVFDKVRGRFTNGDAQLILIDVAAYRADAPAGLDSDAVERDLLSTGHTVSDEALIMIASANGGLFST